MRTAAAVSLVVGVLALIAWMVAHSLQAGAAGSEPDPRRDPEARFGRNGRRVVGGLIGFGMAGLSADFGSIDIPPAGVVLAALAGAAAAAWWAGSGFADPSDDA